MMVPGGLNLEAGLTLQPGIVTTQEAAPDTGFTEILATLDAGTAAIAAPIDAATLMPAPVESIVVPDMGEASEPVEDEGSEGAAQAGSQGADTAAEPPFVAPPITIGVSNTSPIVVARAFLAQRGDAVSGQKVTTSQITPLAAPFADAVAIDQPPGPDALVAALARMEPVAPRTLPTGLAPRADGNAAPPSGFAGDELVTIPAASDPVGAIVQPDVPTAPLLPPVTTPMGVEATRLADAAPDTARQLGEQAMAARLDIADESAMIDRLARDLAQLSGSEGRLKFQLNPEHLGSLHVEVEQRAEGVSLRFGTETEGARQVIADAQHRLVNEARAHGMRIAETHVDLNSQNQQGAGRGNTAQQPVVITRGESPDASAAAIPGRRAGVERFA